ncbi:MAG: YHS domain-containing (seleno)protein [Pseudomonadota bacterium]
MTHTLTRRMALTALGAGLALPAKAESLFLDGLGVAIKGYDPVAYFEYEEAVRGKLDFELETEEGNWWFARERHREKFAADPDRFTPQFGGFDAEGMARGFKRRSDPTLWVMIDNRIYLHYTVEDQNRWAQDIRLNIEMAEDHWETLKSL